MTVEVSEPRSTESNAGSYLWVLTVHSALLVASNVGASKVIKLPLHLNASATVVSYVITVIIATIATEVYGPARARALVRFGFLAMIVSVAFFYVTVALPAATDWSNQEAMRAVLLTTPRFLLAGWSAYLIGQYMSVWVMQSVRRRLAQPVLCALAAVGLGQAADTACFVLVGFAGSNSRLIPLFLGQLAVKMFVAMILTPVLVIISRVMLEPAVEETKVRRLA